MKERIKCEPCIFVFGAVTGYEISIFQEILARNNISLGQCKQIRNGIDYFDQYNQDTLYYVQLHRKDGGSHPSVVLSDLLQNRCTSGKDLLFIPILLKWNRNPKNYKVWHSHLFRLLFYRKTILLSSADPIEIHPPVHDDSTEYKTGTDLRRELIRRLIQEHRIITGKVPDNESLLTRRILRHSTVRSAIDSLARNSHKTVPELEKETIGYIREIACHYLDLLPRLWKIILEPFIAKGFSAIEFDYSGLQNLRNLLKQKCRIVIIPNHRSHFDYLVISYGFYIQGIVPPLVAAGHNLAFWPLGYIFRRTGAFFIRRTFRGLDLYPPVFKSYVKHLLNSHRTIEFFIEGTRSRNGLLKFPKLGFLGILLDAFQNDEDLNLQLVPVAINYDRIIEEEGYALELQGLPKRREKLSELIKNRHLLKRKYGKVYVTIGDPISMTEFASLQPQNTNLKEPLGLEVMRGIHDSMPITPVSIILAAFMSRNSTEIVSSDLEKRAMALFNFISQSQFLAKHIASTHFSDDWYRKNMSFLLSNGLISIKSNDEITGTQVYLIHQEKWLLGIYMVNTLLGMLFPACVAEFSRNSNQTQAVAHLLSKIIFPSLYPLPVSYARDRIDGYLSSNQRSVDPRPSILISLILPLLAGLRFCWNSMVQSPDDNIKPNHEKMDNLKALLQNFPIAQVHSEILTTEILDWYCKTVTRLKGGIPDNSTNANKPVQQNDPVVHEMFDLVEVYMRSWMADVSQPNSVP